MIFPISHKKIVSKDSTTFLGRELKNITDQFTTIILQTIGHAAEIIHPPKDFRRQ